MGLKVIHIIVVLFCSVILKAQQVKIGSLYERIYQDTEVVEDVNSMPKYEVPRNYTLSFPVIMRSELETSLKVDVFLQKNDDEFSVNTITTHSMLPVRVEGNTQGSMINVPGGDFPKSWMPYLVRRAPFDVLEALIPFDLNDSISLKPMITKALMVSVDIKPNMEVGLYKGSIRITNREGCYRNYPFRVQIHPTIINRADFLDCVHWLSPSPADLCKSGNDIAWWGEEHWSLLKKVGDLLYRDGNNMMYTPLLSGDFPLVQAIYINGNLDFDYSLFDRWIKMFSSLGFKYFSGSHLRTINQSVKIRDVKTGRLNTISNYGMDVDSLQNSFLFSLNKHLEFLGIKDKFVMHLYDEPRFEVLDEYKYYSNKLKKLIPGLLSIDATNSTPEKFSQHVDIQVYNLRGIVSNKDQEVKKRLAEGKKVWLYNTSGPFPPYPNRHLDRCLIENRLWPLLTYKYGASGYLFWAVNTYRGVKDEYLTSLGPLPDGTQKHCPGDAWFYYRTSNGLISSVRMLCFREGMVDVALMRMCGRKKNDYVLEQLEKLIWPQIELGHERPWADYPYIAEDIARGYELDPKKYDIVRTNLLNMLEN